MTLQLTDERAFKLQFIANFLSTWCATEYNNACINGEHRRLEKPPVEDAEYLADTAWAYYVEYCL